MTEREAAAWLKSLPREKSQEEVNEVEGQHDADRGPYVPHEHHAIFEIARH